MGQKLREDKIGAFSESGGTITMTASTPSPAWLTIGGQQYKITASLSRTISTDVAMSTNTPYYVYAIVSSGTVQLRVSANNNDVGPSGFNSWKLLNTFTSNSSSLFGAFSSSLTRTDSSPIGMIVPSMLTEAQFQSLNGSSWVLAQGQTATGTAYASITGQSTVPDLRGMFLRGKNNGRADGQQDPGGERTVGNLQGQATAKNGLAISDPGHTHSLTNRNAGIPGSGNGVAAATAASGGTTDVSWSGTGVSLGAGDAETRPKNVAVNYFIKVNP